MLNTRFKCGLQLSTIMKIALVGLIWFSSLISVTSGIKCRICDEPELSPNNAYYAGRCDSESDYGSLQDTCPFENSQYCLKLTITLNEQLKRETDLYEKNFLNDQLMRSVFTQKEREELKESLAAQTSVYTKHGTLRGCAKLRGNFGDNQNCTSTDRGGVNLVTCLCNDSDYCNRACHVTNINILLVLGFPIVFYMSKNIFVL